MKHVKETNKVDEIIRNGFVLPTEIEKFFVDAKIRMVESVLKARDEGRMKRREFVSNADSLWAAIPEELKTTAVLTHNGIVYRTVERWEWELQELNRINKSIPFYGRSDAEAVRLIEEDCGLKRMQFIIRTNAITGDTITNANLFVDNGSGDINGTISGTRGTARVKTIGAGGYNVQCYHFRCLVRAV